MEVGGSVQSTADRESSDVQLRQGISLGCTESISSSVESLSFSLHDGCLSHVNEAAENGKAGDQEHHSDEHHIIIPLSVENTLPNGVAPSQHGRSGSLERASSGGASLRRLFSSSTARRPRQDEDVESEIVSEAGDIGDRALSRRGSQRESARFSLDQGVVHPIPEELLEAYGFWSYDTSKINPASPVPPLKSEIVTPLATDPMLPKNLEKKKELSQYSVSSSLEYISCLAHLAVFGILGVLTRFLLQRLFGPRIANVTSDQSILYLDLPSNMVGSFLMGWFGVVFKGDISRLSDQLAIGISTGYLGSLTTFSGWNQKMLELSVKGHWLFAILGFLIGLFLAAYSIIIGVETAKGLRWLFEKSRKGTIFGEWRVDNNKRHFIALFFMMVIWGGLWASSVTLEKEVFKSGGSAAQLWLACLVGPFGVWIRWWLAGLNGRGLGKAGLCKWLPFGTLAANVSAACMMAALATAKKAVNTKSCDTVATGIQFGFLGCLSTVSTFMAEFNAMRGSSHPWRAYAYATLTIGLSFGLGTLIYSVPVWTRGYD